MQQKESGHPEGDWAPTGFVRVAQDLPGLQHAGVVDLLDAQLHVVACVHGHANVNSAS